jgi:hypothetical protein
VRSQSTLQRLPRGEIQKKHPIFSNSGEKEYFYRLF